MRGGQAAGNRVGCLRGNAAPGQGWAGEKPFLRRHKTSFPSGDKRVAFTQVTEEELSVTDRSFPSGNKRESFPQVMRVFPQVARVYPQVTGAFPQEQERSLL